jgi:hypothetical protein
MKFTLKRDPLQSYWNGVKPLPDEINVLHYHPQMAEFELLSIICTLHGYVTAFDILTGAETGTEKDTDITSVMTAFQHYISPKMPLSNYTGSDKRTKPIGDKKVVPIDPNGI